MACQRGRCVRVRVWYSAYAIDATRGNVCSVARDIVPRTPRHGDGACVRVDGLEAHACHPHAIGAKYRPQDRPPPRRRRSDDSDTEANLGHVRRVRPPHGRIHREHKSNFFGRQRKGDGPARRLAFARRVDEQFVRGGFNNFLGGGRSSARRGGPERLLVDGATLNKFFVALLEGFIRLE